MLLTCIYKHTHECPLKDTELEVRPTITQGAAFITQPICAYTLCELELIEVRNEWEE